MLSKYSDRALKALFSRKMCAVLLRNLIQICLLFFLLNVRLEIQIEELSKWNYESSSFDIFMI